MDRSRSAAIGACRASCSLYTGISWKHLPPELGFGSGITCWRWCEAGVWDRLHRRLLSEPHALGEIDWSAVCLDGPHVRAKKGARAPALHTVDRGRPGAKHHIACDSTGIPLADITAAGDIPDIRAAPHLVEALGPVAGGVGRPRRRPDVILADGGCDSATFRDWPRSKRIEPIIPQRGRRKFIGLGTIRRVVERAIAHLHQLKRIAVRWDRLLSMHEGFVKLAASLICSRRLTDVLPCRN